MKLWTCKWSSVLVVDIEQGSDSVDNNLADIVMELVLNFQKKKDVKIYLIFLRICSVVLKKMIILISQREHQQLTSRLQQILGKDYAEYEDDGNFLGLDDKSQVLLLKRTDDFQGTEVLLEALVGKHPPEIIKEHIDSYVFPCCWVKNINCVLVES
jgi:hypothetical protein